MELTLQERRAKILELLHHSGKVRVAQLSEQFGISEVSIRNDLAGLEESGLLSRVRGGAVSSYDSYYNMSLAQRSNTNRREKSAIAEAIAEMIHDGQSVMMNAGTTTLAVMECLRSKKNITIITNSIVLALEGAKYNSFDVILLGGSVNYDYQFVYGASTLREIKDYYVDSLILSADGIDAENGITTYYCQEAELCCRMLKQAKQVIAALDFTKIGRVTLKKIADIQSVDCLVTNSYAPSDTIEEIKGKGVNVVLV